MRNILRGSGTPSSARSDRKSEPGRIQSKTKGYSTTGNASSSPARAPLGSLRGTSAASRSSSSSRGGALPLGPLGSIKDFRSQPSASLPPLGGTSKGKPVLGQLAPVGGRGDSDHEHESDRDRDRDPASSDASRGRGGSQRG